ncbi:Nicotinamidase-related amidase [Cohaesibacter sp. ES.047]|uniref:cysteine hydrolase family protein n=1 Tax=Cohaesibacter sp. ES.047 TaxID=1798205 RepID=UPI000BB89CF2|nr:cysteine hydrolase family protein [Cohaesibacter sp. ES.047]SNY93879.1 Nicotinamidase-related amidase [Cohaesibacter sp. ES.047]
MSLREKSPILLCIDVQMGFQDEAYWGGGRNNPQAEEVVARVIHAWRVAGLEVIHVRHSSSDPNSKLHQDNAGFQFHPLATPLEGETIVTKSVNSSFIGTDLKDILDGKGCNTLVILGLTTDHCVSTTTRMAGNYGYETYLVSDATACFDRVGLDGERLSSDLIHKTALASLNGEFATVLPSSRLLSLL